MASNSSSDLSYERFRYALQNIALDKLNEQMNEIQTDMESFIRESVGKFYADYTPQIYERVPGLYDIYNVSRSIGQGKIKTYGKGRNLGNIEIKGTLKFSFDPSMVKVNPFDFTYHDRNGGEHKGHYDGSPEYAYQSAFIEGKHGGGRFMMKQSDSPWQDIGIYALYKYNAQVIGL